MRKAGQRPSVTKKSLDEIKKKTDERKIKLGLQKKKKKVMKKKTMAKKPTAKKTKKKTTTAKKTTKKMGTSKARSAKMKLKRWKTDIGMRPGGPKSQRIKTKRDKLEGITKKEAMKMLERSRMQTEKQIRGILKKFEKMSK